MFINKKKLVVYLSATEVHPSTIGIHPSILLIRSLEIDLATFEIDLACIYIDLMNKRKALYLHAFLVRLICRRLSKKRALFVDKKALYFRVLFVEDYREKELFLLVKKHYIFAPSLYVLFVEDYRKKELFLLIKKHCIPASSSRSSFFRSLSLYR